MNNIIGYQPTEDITTDPPDHGSSVQNPHCKIDVTLCVTKIIKHEHKITLDNLEKEMEDI